MSPKASSNILARVVAGAIVLSLWAPAFAEDAVAMKVDAGAAQKLARNSSCLRCHAVGRKKEGPSYQSIAYKYKGRSDAADVLFKHITAGDDKVKLTDGHEEVHKNILGKASPESIKNLVAWILSQ